MLNKTHVCLHGLPALIISLYLLSSFDDANVCFHQNNDQQPFFSLEHPFPGNNLSENILAFIV